MTRAINPNMNPPWTAGAPVRQRARVTRKPPTLQARTQEQDARPVATRYECSEHQIHYYVPQGSSARCPLCAAENEIEELRVALQDAETKYDQLYIAAGRMRADTDLLYAMRAAIDTTSAEDLAFLKGVLYRYRQDKLSVQLKVLHGKPQGRGHDRTTPPVGWLVADRGGEFETYNCASVGGFALAGYFEEAVRLWSLPKAMETLLRALTTVMPGGQQ